MEGRGILRMVLASALLLAGCSAARPARPVLAPSLPATAPPSAEDGERYALLRSVGLSEGEVHVVADYARVLRGAEASAAAAERDPLFTGPLRYLVVNDTREDVALPLARTVRIRCLAGDGPALRDVAATDFVSRWLEAGNGDAIRRDPYRIVVEDGAVTLLEQQYPR